MTRITQLQQKLTASDLAAVLITDPVNVRYLTGFTGEESAVLVSAEAAWFITDSRFTEQVKKQVTDATLVLHEHGLFKKAGELAQEYQLALVGFEADVLSYADFTRLPEGVTWQPAPNWVAQLREIKDESELAHIKRAIDIAMAGYDHVLATIKPGMREIDVATALDFHMRSLGASGVSFETIVASGPRSAMPHGAATEREIQVGDIITLDWGCVVDGYVSDVTRTFALGQADAKIADIYRIVFACNQATGAMMGPGVLGATINDFAHDYIERAGYGEFFGHGVGHGIGLSIHEGPGGWGPYQKVPQAIGNVETVEPGIYLPDVGGVRIEDDVLITASGVDVLTPPAPAEILVVPV